MNPLNWTVRSCTSKIYLERLNLPIPDFQTLMRPFLEFVSDGKEHSLAEARERLAQVFKLSDEEKKALLPSGKQPRFTNRVAWARVYLGQAGALDSPKRGYFRITDRGRTFLGAAPERITIKDLEQFPEFHKFRSASKVHKEEPAGSEENGQTPEEMLESAYQKFTDGIASELLARVKSSSADFFEHLVVELLLKMGYGGSRRPNAEVLGAQFMRCYPISTRINHVGNEDEECSAPVELAQIQNSLFS